MEDTYNIRLSRRCYYVCLGIIAAAIIVGCVLMLLEIPITKLDKTPCVWITYLGVYCPGCGGTRAVEALMQGEFLQSFLYHPVVLYTAGMMGGYVSSHALNIFTGGRVKALLFHGWYLYLMLAIIIVQWLVKNVLKLVFLIELC